MPEIDLAPYRAYWQTRARRDEEARTAVVARARTATSTVAKLLTERGARRVWLIGSLPRGAFQPGSDLDFMTEGLGEQAARVAAAEAAERSGFLVWRAYHQRHGELLHV